MRILKLTTVLAAVAMAASPALATTIVNQDTKEHTLTVDRGKEQKDHKIAAGDSLKVDCPEKCGFRLGTVGYGRQAGNDEKLVIGADGMLGGGGSVAR